jgi:hypothetical protein
MRPTPPLLGSLLLATLVLAACGGGSGATSASHTGSSPAAASSAAQSQALVAECSLAVSTLTGLPAHRPGPATPRRCAGPRRKSAKS